MNKEKIKIGIDLDEVVADFINKFLEFYNGKYEKNILKEDIKSYNLWENDFFGFDKQGAIQIVDEFYDSELFDEMELIQDATRVIRELSDDFEIFIVTSRPLRFKEKTENFLKNNQILYEIIYSNEIHNANGSKNKADICKELGVNILIDDNKDYAKNCAENNIKVFLLSKPWNSNHEKHENIIKVENWQEILDIVKDQNFSSKNFVFPEYVKNTRRFCILEHPKNLLKDFLCSQGALKGNFSVLDYKIKTIDRGHEKNIKLIDEAYGEEEINEPVLIKLINSKPVQRLKKISQYGIPDEYYHKNNYSRYDHSIGVLILLRKFKAGIKEQIAGLLHDISHTAFSHVIDWAIGDSTKEDFQDNNHLNVLKNSEIPLILKKYGFDYNEISNLDKFSLLEKEAPSLCADRIDYTLRELHKDGFDIGFFLENLMNKDNMIVFKNLESAEKFAYQYLRLQNEHWAGAQAKVRYFILGSILKRAFENKIITIEDTILHADMDIIKKLKESFDNIIIGNLKLLKNRLSIEESGNKGILLKKKFRYIDPEVLFNGEILRVSELSKEYALVLENEKKNSAIEKRYIYNAICT